jgi:dihydroxyacetone kinase-like protein
MINGQQWTNIVRAMADAVITEREALSALDLMVGDGDHGISLSKALDEAARQVAALPSPSPEHVLKTAGIAVQNTMGGASGILFGAFLIGMSHTSSSGDISIMLADGLLEVQKRGKAARGDKTMVDALASAVDAAQRGEPLDKVAEAAKAGAESTQNMIAKFGRAKFLGERSLGFQDAGATSIAVMLAALAGAMRGQQ